MQGHRPYNRLDLLAPEGALRQKDHGTKKKPTAGIEPSPERLEAGYSTAEVHRHHGSQSRFGEKKDIRCSIAVKKKFIRP